MPRSRTNMIGLVAATALFLSTQGASFNSEVAGLWVTIGTNGVEYKAWLRLKPDGTWQMRLAEKKHRDRTASGKYVTRREPTSTDPNQLDKWVVLDTLIFDGKRLTEKDRLETRRGYVFMRQPEGDLLTDILTTGYARVEQAPKMRAKYGAHPDPGRDIKSKGP